MEKNASAFPDPPGYYKQRLSPPKPPEEGEFSMFGRTYTTKEAPLLIETSEFSQIFTDQDLQDPLFFQKTLLIKLQNSLMAAAIRIIKSLAVNPSDAFFKFKEYERIIVNFYQLLYWMRPLQALLQTKERLILQIESKEKLRNELMADLQDLKTELQDILTD